MVVCFSLFRTGILQVEQVCLVLGALSEIVISSGRLSVALLVSPWLSTEGVDEGGPVFGVSSFRDMNDVMSVK